MKIWQKTLMLVMGLSLIAPFAACKEENPQGNSFNDLNNQLTVSSTEERTIDFLES